MNNLKQKKPNAIQKLFRKIEIFFESLNGLDFSSVNSIEDLGLNKDLVSKCSPSGNHYLHKTLLKLNISKNDSILDVGCGKGSAIRVFLKFNFNKVGGVDLSEFLINTAKNNFIKLKITKPQFYCSNILEFKNFDEYNYFYLYNPFPEEVFKSFLEKLNSQVKDKVVYIIYNNPVCHNLLIDDGFDFLNQYPDMWGNGINVYSKKID